MGLSNTQHRSVPSHSSSLEELELPKPYAHSSQRESFSALDTYSLAYKHPVTNFDFVSTSGAYKGVNVNGIREGESRTDTTGTIRITGMGVGNDGYRFRIELGDNFEYSMRTRAGETEYAFKKISVRDQISSESSARNLYKKYCDFYNAASGSEEQCHRQAVSSLKSTTTINTDAISEIEKWADASNNQETRGFFKRLANSLV